MKKYLTILLFFTALAVQAQTMTKEEVIGKWKTVKVGVVSKMPANELKEMQQMFSNSTFDFQANGVSKISLPGGNQEFKAMFAKNLWKYDAKKKEIKIGTNADNYSVMGIIAKKVGDKVYFELLESGIQLEVSKI